MRLESAVLREYFSGVPLSSLTRRYGVNGRRIEAMASDYMKGKIDIFDPGDKKAIEMSKLSHKEEVRLLKEKIAILEDALKMANIKAEGADIMMGILKDRYGSTCQSRCRTAHSREAHTRARFRPVRLHPSRLLEVQGLATRRRSMSGGAVNGCRSSAGDAAVRLPGSGAIAESGHVIGRDRLFSLLREGGMLRRRRCRQGYRHAPQRGCHSRPRVVSHTFPHREDAYKNKELPSTDFMYFLLNFPWNRGPCVS